MSAGIRVLPRHGRARAPIFQRLHLRRIGALLILVIHSRADPIANEAADSGAGQSSGNMLAGPAAELRPDQTAGQGAEKGSRVLLGPLSGLRSGAASAQNYCDKRPLAFAVRQ